MRRRLLMILLLLLGGAIVNVAVAWGCCMYGYRDATAQSTLRRPPNSDERTWWIEAAPPSGVLEPYEVWPTRVVGYAETRHVGHGPIVTRPAGGQVELTSAASWLEAGWPVRSLRGTWFVIPDATTGSWRRELRGAWRIDSFRLSQVFPRRVGHLPSWPTWPGFAINTVFYTLILWLLFAAPFALRRHRRIKRGLCPKCAYDLRNRASDSSVCPECESAMPKSP